MIDHRLLLHHIFI